MKPLREGLENAEEVAGQNSATGHRGLVAGQMKDQGEVDVVHVPPGADLLKGHRLSERHP
jgi:hypothetical protein